jgi:succinylarginine dihydrolase
MWTANAATVSPSADTGDGRVHFTPANLVSHFHRSLEAATTTRVLRAIFADASRFAVHDPLPAAPQFGDEGAANHIRLATAADAPGVELFAYGRAAFDASAPAPRRYPARQTREASAAIARRHGLDPARTAFAQQNGRDRRRRVPQRRSRSARAACCSATSAPTSIRARARRARSEGRAGLPPIVVGDADVSVDDAVSTYLFNSQLLCRSDGKRCSSLPPSAGRSTGPSARISTGCSRTAGRSPKCSRSTCGRAWKTAGARRACGCAWR